MIFGGFFWFSSLRRSSSSNSDRRINSSASVKEMKIPGGVSSILKNFGSELIREGRKMKLTCGHLEILTCRKGSVNRLSLIHIRPLISIKIYPAAGLDFGASAGGVCVVWFRFSMEASGFFAGCRNFCAEATKARRFSPAAPVARALRPNQVRSCRGRRCADRLFPGDHQIRRKKGRRFHRSRFDDPAVISCFQYVQKKILDVS